MSPAQSEPSACDLLKNAEWIGTPLEGTGLTAPPTPMLRRRFTLTQTPAKASLTITALGVYEPWLNGQRVGDLELQPGWTDYHQRLHVQTYDVTEQLALGDNMLGVWLGDGWYSGKVAHYQRGLLWGTHPKLRAVLNVEDEQGQTTQIATDSQWRWRIGPILSSDLLDGEHYDARKRITDWCEAGATEDAHWSAVELDKPAYEPKLAISPAPPVRVTEQLTPISDPILGKETWGLRQWLFDFGQNFTGKVRLHVKGPAGATLQLRYAEVLTPDGDELDTSNLRSCIATDSYTLSGDPQGETWTPRFTFHGFRYAVIICHKTWVDPQRPDAFEPFTRQTLTGLVLHNDMQRIGHFETGHKLLNRLQQNIVWGLRSNFLEVPTDCPQRDERLGWTGDAQVFAPTATFNYDVTGFFTKWLNDMADSQLSNGGIPRVVPNVTPKEDSAAGWSDVVVLVPWTVYRASGRRSLLEQHYDMMKRWAVFQAETARDGVRGDPDHDIFEGHGDWLAIDVDPIKPSVNATPKRLVGTAYHAYSQGLFARIADLLDHPDDAADAQAARDRAVAAFNADFVANGRVTVRSQTAHLMALAFDLLDPTLRDAVFADLLELLAERDYHLSTGFLGTPLWCDVLTRFGRVDLAYNLLLNETYPGWLYPITLGATTMWERWNSWHPKQGFVTVGMNSLNHYAYGAVGDWMYRTIAGINLDMSQQTDARLRLTPHPDRRLGHCRASLDSPIGRIESQWAYEGDTVQYEVQVPDGATAQLTQPMTAEGESNTVQLDPGVHRFTQTV